MQYGVVLTWGSASELVDLAQEAEAAGWDGVLTWDGISVGPVDTFDPWVLLGAMAVRTERVRLGAMVVPPARRRPWKLAREALTVDHLSGGRLVLPVGLGAADDAGFRAVAGEARTPRERAERMDEALAILDRAWTGQPFGFRGAHHQVEEMVILPRPVQRPRIPVWPVALVGSTRSMARAARWDGAVLQTRGVDGPFRPEEVRDAVTALHAQRAADGRTGTFDVVVSGVTATRAADADADAVAALEAAGATWWVEARWDESVTVADQRRRIRQGPPRG